jgi:UbiD family decarboxylase
MKKRVDGEPKIAASAAFAVDPILKHIWIVDDDIDVFDNDQVLWAMTTRFQADRDLIIMPNFLGGHLNPPKCEVPQDVVESVDPQRVVKPLDPGTKFSK